MSDYDFLEELRQGYLSNFSSEMENIESLILSLEKNIDIKESLTQSIENIIAEA